MSSLLRFGAAHFGRPLPEELNNRGDENAVEEEKEIELPLFFHQGLLRFGARLGRALGGEPNNQ